MSDTTSLIIEQESAHAGDRVALRLPPGLAADIRAIARRDANNLSATARRLLAAAIEREKAARARG